MKIPRVVISAANSGSGKTMITCGIARALRRRGYKVQTFKIGPDFIDPKYLSLASGRRCVNLDSWLMDEKTVLRDFEIYAQDADIALIEGVRSLYDSADPLSLKGSTFSIAKILDAPILLVVDIRGLNLGTAAIVKGFTALFDAGIRGVILNSSRGEKHEEKARKAVEELLKIDVLGVIPRMREVEIKMRHLGLITVEETRSEAQRKIERWSEIAEERINLDRIVDIANSSSKLPDLRDCEKECGSSVKIAVAYDKAFNFYYTQNLDILRRYGAELNFFSPLSEEFPECDGIIIGGGYPEFFAHEFNKKNASLLKRIEEECPTLAECGGLMFLCEELHIDDKVLPGLGVISAEAVWDINRRFLGYTKWDVVEANPLSQPGKSYAGHEFHYSYLNLNEEVKFAYEMRRGYGINGRYDGIVIHNTLASYTHHLFSGQEALAKNFINACREFKRK